MCNYSVKGPCITVTTMQTQTLCCHVIVDFHTSIVFATSSQWGSDH